jgi:hypothetical protein
VTLSDLVTSNSDACSSSGIDELGTSSFLWLLLTFLEGSCFRHPINQVPTCLLSLCYCCIDFYIDIIIHPMPSIVS